MLFRYIHICNYFKIFTDHIWSCIYLCIDIFVYRKYLISKPIYSIYLREVMYRYSFDFLFLAKLENYLYSNFCMTYK